MNAHIRGEFRRLRRLGWSAREAIRSARIDDRFADLEAEGLVRLELKPDDWPARDFLCACGERDCEAKHQKKELETIDRDGVWGVLAQFRVGEDFPWETADSVWGFIGDTWKDSGYDTDLKEAAVRILEPVSVLVPGTVKS